MTVIKLQVLICYDETLLGGWAFFWTPVKPDVIGSFVNNLSSSTFFKMFCHSWTDFHLDLFFNQITNENQSSSLCIFKTLINGLKKTEITFQHHLA